MFLSVGTTYSNEDEQPNVESTNINQGLQELLQMCDAPSRGESYLTQLIDNKDAIQDLDDENPLKQKYIDEVTQAEKILPDAQKRKLYSILGHRVYTNLYTRNQLVPNIDLIQYFQDLSTTDNLEPLRKAIELYGMLVEEVPIENALNRLTPSRNRNEQEEKKYQTLNDNQKKVADALGPFLYTKIPKEKLSEWTNFAKTNSKTKILKRRLNAILCEFEQTEKQKTETGKPTTPEQQKKSAPQKETTEQKKLPVVKGKAPENIDKANAKLGSALRSLKNAKRWLREVDRQERTNIKKRVENILKENATGIQQMADRIKQLKPGPNIPSAFKKFSTNVQQIYNEFRGL
jgi:hypothetical protein